MLQDRLPEYRMELDKPHEECGIFGLYLHPSLASNDTANLALESALQNQHRGEESAGMIISDGYSVWPAIKTMGLIRDLYGKYKSEKAVNGGIYGHIVNVHNRYSTTGSSIIENAAPYRFESNLGTLGVSHNGNITNAVELKSKLISKGYSFMGTTDSEVIGVLIADSAGETWQEKVYSASQKLQGAFCLVVNTKDKILAVRDRYGFHPLYLGSFGSQDKQCFAVSSETPAIQMLNPTEVRMVNPGEIVEIGEEGLTSIDFAQPDEHFCGLEMAYLMRPDGYFENTQLDTIRRHHGELLAATCPVPKTTDFVTYIPESAKSASEGFANELSQIQNRPVQSVTTMMKGRYGTLKGNVRGFINPDLNTRKSIASTHYYPYDIVEDKEIALVEDSVIAGVTTDDVMKIYRKAVGLFKDRGVRRVHLRVVFPKVISSCPYGIDIDDSRFLIAKEFEQNTEEICKHIGADSLGYLVVDEYGQGVNNAVGRRVNLCLGCTTGVYPESVNETNKLILESEVR
jgi:amidophosphoribosyltransferase